MKKGSHHSLETKKKISLTRNKYKGMNHPRWKGGKIIVGGYIYIYSPKHPNKTQDGYVCEHRLLMEKKIGRFLLSSEIVHHINGNPLDNRLENLILISGKSDHRKAHPEISALQRKNFKGKRFSPKTEFKKGCIPWNK